MGPTEAVTLKSDANVLVFPESRNSDGTELGEPLPFKLLLPILSSHI